MQIPLHILTKKYLFWVALAVLFMMIPSPVYAIKLETVVVDSELSLDISDEGYADASYVLNIHNSDQELVSGLNINIPFLDLENLQASLNGNYLAVTSASQSEYTTLQLEFGGLAIRTNQDAKLLLQFRVPKAVSG
ncbi:hypothetical protein KC640_03875, partial [Candidatus Dojkabacteria bacterium]|nr:hypothetical protein [Candidatus Dojkabacteria bacterium]